MDRPAPTSATAREIILEIVRNMREGLEPLHYSTLAPAIYHVYLHPDDLDRLRGIVPRIVEEARRALDEEMMSLNRGSIIGRLKLTKESPKISVPEGGWQIRVLENNEDDIEPGDIVVSSELALPARQEFGAGSMTRRIATRRMGGRQLPAAVETAETPSSPPSPTSILQPEAGAFAVLEYDDNGIRKTYHMTKDQIVVGRGGRDYWTDLKLDTLPDVSREHCRLRRDPQSGEFFLKDLSRLGTTLNGQRIPSSVEFSEGQKRDRNVEVPVPRSARIGLADVVFLEFRSAAAPGVVANARPGNGEHG